MNSFIRTATGLSLVINSQPYTVESDHPNYSSIVDALRASNWEAIPDLITVTHALKTWTDETSTESDLEIDVDGGVILFKGEEVRGVIANRILDMYIDGFDVTPMAKFLANLYANPSNKAVEQLYGWMEANGITITEDGYLLAFKRVRNDYTSFFDGTTDNTIGTTPELPRNKVDDRSDVTCSHGLHFCSHAYLPHYNGGQGRVLLLKINPADVVSIPNDYNNAKGRACKYLILDELQGDARAGIETHNVIPQPVVTEQTDYNASNSYKAGYRAGYKDGRGKQVMYKSYEASGHAHTEYDRGYVEGRVDGRAKKPNLFATDADRKPIIEAVPLCEDQVIEVIRDYLGLLDDVAVSPQSTASSLSMDSLDEIELVMALEDEFDIELYDGEVERCRTVRQLTQLIESKLA